MALNRKPQKILVVSLKPDLAEITRKAVGPSIEVDYSSSESETLEKIRSGRPEIVILGYLEPPGAELKFARQLREGWISRHSSLIVIQLNPTDGSHRILSDENLPVGIGEYSYLAGESCPLFPQELLLPRLKEKIQAKLDQRANKLKDSILNPDAFCLTWEQ